MYINSAMERNKQLQPFNTFNVQACANYFATVNSVQDAQTLLKNRDTNQLSKLVLGGGSNILFTQDFSGLVIRNKILGIEAILEDDNNIWLTIGAGENWHQFVLYCIAHNYAGIENLSLIPGTVGAAPVQNIGAYGAELESVFESLSAIDLITGDNRTFSQKQCQFGYRDSIFKKELKNKFLITHVTLKLSKHAHLNTTYGAVDSVLKDMKITQPSIADISKAVIQIRNQKLPNPETLPNAGSFFKNPIIELNHFEELKSNFPEIPSFPQPNQQIKIPAAWLIDHCNLKGFKENGVGISSDHALVLVNYNNPKGAAIQALSREVQDKVSKKFNVYLDTEVNIH
jgi:UDP-N-acetylmuramate dehydrogenase